MVQVVIGRRQLTLARHISNKIRLAERLGKSTRFLVEAKVAFATVGFTCRQAKVLLTKAGKMYKENTIKYKRLNT